ncbi:MAG TPA: lanthionine synthetase LanC family protein, partial [Longimicrobiaceae bacterium]|nr:lanthionine synthetase LanC family protein [Longimicrobiaceae bacterium]
RLLDRLLHPRFLADGVMRSLEIETLCAPLLRHAEPPAGWAAFRAERAELERLDVPVLAGRADAAGPLRSRSGFDAAVHRLREMNGAGLELQRRLICSAFVERTPPGAAPEPFTPAAALAEAHAIAERLASLAIERGDGVAWLSVARAADPRDSGFGYTDLSLERGAAGIALFLAACARETGRAGHRELALRAIRPLLARPEAAGLGGGLIYALTRLGPLLDDEEPLRAARVLAARVTPARVRADRAFGVLDGCAGALLGLLALHRATGEAEPLRHARICGRHLLEHRPWRKALPPGFARGAPGIAHALVQLHRATGDPEPLRAAADAFACGDVAADAGWHAGASGVALALAASGEMMDGDALRDALETIDRDPLRTPDHLYAGGFGAMVALLVAGDRHAAYERAGAAVRRARRRGHFAVGIDDVYAPGLLEGLAGVGCALLRLHRPSFPCVLLWE